MPGFHKIRAHRIACLALYKAFLSHCRHLPFSYPTKTQTQTHICKQFRKGRTIQGLQNIRQALSSAYEVNQPRPKFPLQPKTYKKSQVWIDIVTFTLLPLLNQNEALFRSAATGNSDSVDILADKLKKLIELRKQQIAMSRTPSRPPPTFPPPLPPTRQKRIKRAALDDPVTITRRLKAIKIHRRRLPLLVETSQFPMLRRPGRRQSIVVSTTIKKKIKKKQQRIDLSDTLEEWIQIAKEEDIFDDHVRRIVPGQENDGKWFTEAKFAFQVVKSRMRKAEMRGIELTQRFLKIIEKENVVKQERIAAYTKEKRRRLRQKRRNREKESQTKT